MSSDSEGGGRRPFRQRSGAFSSDDDLGGGGLGFGGGRRKRRGGNDANILGVFESGGESDDGGGAGRKGKGKGKRSNSPQKPVSFVRGASIAKREMIKKIVEVEGAVTNEGIGDAEDSETEIDARFKFDGAPNTQGLPVREQGPLLPPRNSMSFNQMATQYGKGYELMMKMGFKGGGLGKHEDGIANPIEVIKRKDRQGLQDEGEMASQDLYGRESGGGTRSIEELLSSKSKKADDPIKPSEAWKKQEASAKRPKITYKTAAEVAAAALAGEQPSIRIVDMRGPQVRVATSFSELAASLTGDHVSSLKELRHNTRLLVAKYEDKIRSLVEKKKYYQDVLLAAEREREQLEAAAAIGPAELEQCRKLAKELEELRIRQADGTLGLGELGNILTRLRASGAKEFKALRAFEVAVALAVPVAKRELGSWQPLEDPGAGLVGMGPWRKLSQGENLEVIQMLLEGALLPRLRHALIKWSPQDPDPCICLVEHLQKAELPPEALDAVVGQIVLPRLRVEVDSWEPPPRGDHPPIHLWVHPWLPVLGSRLAVLWSPIRFRLSAYLDRSDVPEKDVYEAVKPWRQVFHPGDWEPLVEKALGRLERALLETPIRPDGQNVQTFKSLAMWVDTLPLVALERILDVALFPEWHRVLLKWLQAPGCAFPEVLEWYQGWRSLLPSALCERKVVQNHLARGLESMKRFMNQGLEGVDHSARNVVEEAEEHSRAPAQSPPFASDDDSRAGGPRLAAVATEEVSLSLSEYLAQVAAEQGLVFRPKGRTDRHGRQIYQLGAATICMEKSVVYAASPGGLTDGDFIPVGFDELLRRAAKVTASSCRKRS